MRKLEGKEESFIRYLSSSQNTQPPAFETRRVLLQYGQNITFSKSQLVWCFGYVVVQRSCFHTFLLQRKENDAN